MKSIFLFCTRLRYFFTVIPPLFILAIAIKYNSGVEATMKLYPLIIASSGVIIFILLYFFRAIKINFEEIKCIGLFSSRESTVINKDKTLHITILPKRKILLEIYGQNDNFETYAWLKNEDSTEINLFRAKALGNLGTARKILSYFEIDAEDIEKAITSDVFSADYEKITLNTEIADDKKTFKIYFKETV